MNTTSTANDWFRKAAEIEREYDITIGSSVPKGPRVSPRQAGGLGALALGKLVELRRRDRALSMDQLAVTAGVSVADVVRIERRGLLELGLSIAVIESCCQGAWIFLERGNPRRNSSSLDRRRLPLSKRQQPNLPHG